MICWARGTKESPESTGANPEEASLSETETVKSKSFAW